MIRQQPEGHDTLRRETPALRSKSGPGGTLYQYGLCELAQRQAVLMRKAKPSDRAIKSDRASRYDRSVYRENFDFIFTIVER